MEKEKEDAALHARRLLAELDACNAKHNAWTDKTKENALKSGVLLKWVDSSIDDDHLDSLWYGGEVLSATFKNYELTLLADGDVRAHCRGYVDDLVDKNNLGRFKDWANSLGLYNDSDLASACGLDGEGHSCLEFGNNNWFSWIIRNTNTGEYVTEDSGTYFSLDEACDFKPLTDWLTNLAAEEQER